MTSGLGELRRILGPLAGVAVCVGMAVGAGILRTPGEIAAAVPAPGWILGVWLFGALLATLDALILAEMASSVPRVGGLVAYLNLSYGKRVAFLVGWSMLLVTWPASLAAVAIATGELVEGGADALAADAPTSPLASAIAVLVIAALAGLNLLGLRFGARVEIALVLAKVLLLAGVCVAAALAAGGPIEGPIEEAAGIATSAAPPVFPGTTGDLLAALGGVMTLVIFSYDGYADAVYMAGETRDPGRAMPRALLMSLLTITALYLFVNVACLWVLGTEGLAASQFPVLDLARTAFGPSGGIVLTVVAVVIVLGAVNAYFLTGPRIARVLAEEGLAVPVLGRVPESGAPVGATLWIAALAIVYALTNRFGELLEVTVPIITVTVGMVAVGLLIQRRRAPERSRPFRTPWAPVVVGLQVALGLCLLLSFCWNNEHAIYVDLGALVVGLLVYEVVRRRGASG